jgi:hypothetical protein
MIIPEVAAQLEAERERQIQDRLLVRTYAIRAYNDQDRDYDPACDDGVDNWLGEHRVPKMYRTEAEARNLAAQAVAVPVLSGLSGQRQTETLIAFRRQGERWRTRLVADLRAAQDDNRALRLSYVEELSTRLNADQAVTTEAAAAAGFPEAAASAAPVPPARFTAQVMTHLTVRLPVGMSDAGLEEAIRSRIRAGLLRVAWEAGVELLGDPTTVILVTRG